MRRVLRLQRQRLKKCFALFSVCNPNRIQVHCMFSAALYLHETIFKLVSFHLPIAAGRFGMSDLCTALKKNSETKQMIWVGNSWRGVQGTGRWSQNAWVWVLRSGPPIPVGHSWGSHSSSQELSFSICKIRAPDWSCGVSTGEWLGKGCHSCPNLTPSTFFLV